MDRGLVRNIGDDETVGTLEIEFATDLDKDLEKLPTEKAPLRSGLARISE